MDGVCRRCRIAAGWVDEDPCLASPSNCLHVESVDDDGEDEDEENEEGRGFVCLNVDGRIKDSWNT